MPRREPEIATATGLEAAMLQHGTRPLSHAAPLAVVLASAHGVGDLDPVENLLTDIRHLSGSLLWILGHALEELDEDTYALKVVDHAWRSVAMIEKRADAADALRSRLVDERGRRSTVPPVSEARPRRGVSPTVGKTSPAAPAAPASAEGAASPPLRWVHVEPLPDVERDPESGEAERHLARCLELARLDAEEVNRTMGSCSPHYAQIARLVHSLATMLRDGNDEKREGPMAERIGAAADVLEFALAEWRAQRSNAEDCTARSAIP